MPVKKHPPTKDRRDIGQVVFLSEKFAESRELSSCCIGAEAALEHDLGFEGLMKRLTRRAGDEGAN